MQDKPTKKKIDLVSRYKATVKAKVNQTKCSKNQKRQSPTNPTNLNAAKQSTDPQIAALSLELERKHGKLYTGVCRQVSSLGAVCLFVLMLLWIACPITCVMAK